MIIDDYKVSFKLLKTNEMNLIIPLMQAHTPNIPEESLILRLDQMITQGYECIGIYMEDSQENKKLIGVSGLWTQTRFYCGKSLEPDNVYIESNFRSKGIGEHLMLWIENLAKERKCEAIELNCYIGNEKGQKFWEQLEYKAIGYHYQKKIFL